MKIAKFLGGHDDFGMGFQQLEKEGRSRFGEPTYGEIQSKGRLLTDFDLFWRIIIEAVSLSWHTVVAASQRREEQRDEECSGDSPT